MHADGLDLAGTFSKSSTVAIMLSWLAATQQFADWFDRKFPSPNTTHSSPTLSTGCTTWADGR